MGQGLVYQGLDVSDGDDDDDAGDGMTCIVRLFGAAEAQLFPVLVGKYRGGDSSFSYFVCGRGRSLGCE